MRAALKPLGVVLGLVLAVLCVLSAADRTLENAEGSAPRPLTGFGVAGYRQLANRAMEARSWPLARAAARRVVAWAPVEQASLSLLGMAEQGAGEAYAADAAFRVAGQLGWRDPPTQAYWAAQTAGGPDLQIAVQRVDALLRSGADLKLAAPALAVLEASPGGRAAITDRLRLAPNWLGRYVIDLDGLNDAQAANRTRTILDAAARGIAVPEISAEQLAGFWIGRGRGVQALAVWTRLKGRGALDRTGLWDGDFAKVEDEVNNSPFSWRSSNPGSYQVSVRPASGPPGGVVLVAQSSGTAIERIADQHAALAPGTYRLDWMSGDEASGGGGNLQLAVECAGGTPAPQTPVDAAGQRRSRTFTVPSAGCPVQAIVITDMPPESGPRRGSWIGGIVLRPATRGGGAAATSPAGQVSQG